MYAVIETGSKQYRVEVGTELQVELLDLEPGQTIILDRVLLVADGDSAAVGRPVVDGATVSAEVVRRDRGEKLIAFKYRPKARRRVKKGHRQQLTILRVADIVFGGKSAAETVRKAQDAARTERQRLEEAAARQAAEDAALAAKLGKAAEPRTTPTGAGAKATASGAGQKATGKADKAADRPRRTTKPVATEPKQAKSSTRAPGRKVADEGSTAGDGPTTAKRAGKSSPAPRRAPRTKKDG